MLEEKDRKISFYVNTHGWVLISQLLGKIILRAHKVKSKGMKSDEDNQHRCFEFECEGSVKVKSKLYDTSKFLID